METWNIYEDRQISPLTHVLLEGVSTDCIYRDEDISDIGELEIHICLLPIGPTFCLYEKDCPIIDI